MHRYVEPALLQRNESLADVDVCRTACLRLRYGLGVASEQVAAVHASGIGNVGSARYHRFRIAEQIRPIPVIWVIGFAPAPTATVDRLATTKPP